MAEPKPITVTITKQQKEYMEYMSKIIVLQAVIPVCKYINMLLGTALQPEKDFSKYTKKILGINGDAGNNKTLEEVVDLPITYVDQDNNTYIFSLIAVEDITKVGSDLRVLDRKELTADMKKSMAGILTSMFNFSSSIFRLYYIDNKDKFLARYPKETNTCLYIDEQEYLYYTKISKAAIIMTIYESLP
jgi:hypothetical protein